MLIHFILQIFNTLNLSHSLMIMGLVIVTLRQIPSHMKCQKCIQKGWKMKMNLFQMNGCGRTRIYGHHCFQALQWENLTDFMSSCLEYSKQSKFHVQ